MNDRTLLELAARAAGFTGYGFFLGDDGIDVSDEMVLASPGTRSPTTATR
ncbi:hypothetical protein ACET4Z_00080 [Pseudomonas aeruginosa]